MKNLVAQEHHREQHRSRSRRFARNKALLLLCLPALVHLLVFAYVPMPGLLLAFKRLNYSLGFFDSPWVGLENFRFFFQSMDAWRITRNTLGMNAIFIVSNLVVQIFFALLLHEVGQRAAKVYQIVMFLPFYLSWVIVAYLGFAFLNSGYGYINTVLKMVGLSPVSWYFEANRWPAILAIVNIWKMTGYGSVIYYARLMTIEPEYYEAAEMDGATKMQRVRFISIPFLTPMMIVLTILAIGQIFRADFGLFYQVPRDIGALYPTTDVIDTYIYRALMVTRDVGVATATGLFQGVVGLVLVLAANGVVGRIQRESALF